MADKLGRFHIGEMSDMKDPWDRLVTAVVLQAVKDVVSKSGPGQSPWERYSRSAVRRDALSFLRCDNWCLFLRLRPATVRRIRELAHEGLPEEFYYIQTELWEEGA